MYRDFLFLFLNLDTVFKIWLQKNNLWRTERDRISAIKFEAERIHFSLFMTFSQLSPSLLITLPIVWVHAGTWSNVRHVVYEVWLVNIFSSRSFAKMNIYEYREKQTLFNPSSVSTLIERFSYDLEMKAREQNRNNKRTEIERFDWFIERTDKRAWLFIG